MPDDTSPTADLAPLVDLVARLRAPDGCPWDREQRLPDLRTFLLEEAHELAAAIDGGRWEEIAGELGDLLFQVAFIARIGAEEASLSLPALIAAVEAKFVARHPHVFGGERLADAAAVRTAWEKGKAREREAGASLLDGVAPSLPALAACHRLTQKAAGVGFDWPEAGAVLAKLREEIAELEQELATGGDPARREEEVGDLLFTAANLARHLGLDPEGTLARANAKFRRRFAGVEARLAARGRPLEEAPSEELESAWEEVKRDETG